MEEGWAEIKAGGGCCCKLGTRKAAVKKGQWGQIRALIGKIGEEAGHAEIGDRLVKDAPR